MVIGIVGQEHGVSGPLSDFLLMRKSSLTDIDGHPIFSGDIIRLGENSKYPNELFTVTDYADDLCLNREGINLPLAAAVYTNHAKVIGNIFQNEELFSQILCNII